MSLWYAIDWGTTHLRIWEIDASGAVRWETSSVQGMAGLRADEFEDVLLSHIETRLTGTALVLACGMVGARQGWAEAPYRPTPCAATDNSALTRITTRDPRLDVRVAAGLKQLRPADVMRGEETQIAGFLAATPGFDGVLCLPGTHTKWVHVSADEIVSFRSFMTGELFDLLAAKSVLRHSIAEDGWDEDAFQVALADTTSDPHLVAQRLFSIRASALLEDLCPTVARARLSGMLLGLEFAGSRPYWLGQRVGLIGSKALCSIYASGLKSFGVSPEIMDAPTATHHGLTRLHTKLLETA